jgi:hypothetical protein
MEENFRASALESGFVILYSSHFMTAPGTPLASQPHRTKLSIRNQRAVAEIRSISNCIVHDLQGIRPWDDEAFSEMPRHLALNALKSFGQQPVNI